MNQRNVGILMDLILPRTKTPSASELGVHRDYLKFVQAHLANTVAFDTACAEMASLLRTYPSKLQFVEDWKTGKFGEGAPFAFFKDMTVRLYYSSEYATNNIFTYLPVPGRYVGNYRYKAVNRMWAN